MKKHTLRKQDELIVKFFFVLSVFVVLTVLGFTYWFMSAERRDDLRQVEDYQIAIVEENIPDTIEPEEIAVPLTRVVSLCGIEITLPDIGIRTLKADTGDYFPPEICMYYSDNGFTVMVLDRNDTEKDDFTSKKFSAFDRFLDEGDAKEIIDIAYSDAYFAGFNLRTYYDTLARNSVSYTGQIGQDYPGKGVYQVATYLDENRIVYLTQTLFDDFDDPIWVAHFRSQCPDAFGESCDPVEVFRAYMKQLVERMDVRLVLRSINQSSASISNTVPALEL